MSESFDEKSPFEEQIEPPFDANDPEIVAKAEKKSARDKRKKLRVVASIMSSPEGRAWMYDLLGLQCHIFSENPMRETPERNGRFEGERGIGLRVLAEIMTAAPEMFWKMRSEALKREQQ